MDADGRNPRQLTTARNNEAPSWSPDARYVVFSSTRRGTSELWTVNVETGEERAVPGISLSCQGPSWGPRRN
jgi:TolB protein